MLMFILLTVPCSSISEAAASSRPSKTMCKAYYRQQPVCDCIYVTGVVTLCPLFSDLPEYKNKTSFSPKLITEHCQGLDLFFNGVNYVSVDVENSDIVPNGLHCPELDSCDETGDYGGCVLCDSVGVLKFLKVKGVEYTSVADEAARDLRDKPAEAGAEDAREKAVGKSVESSLGESADRPAGSSIEKGGVMYEGNQVRKMVERGGNRPAGKRAGSKLVESASASMGWD